MQNARLRAAAAAANAAQQTAVASVTSLLQERDRLLRENGDLRQEVARLQVNWRDFLVIPSLSTRLYFTMCRPVSNPCNSVVYIRSTVQTTDVGFVRHLTATVHW